jgi:glucose-6-phosphate isomerase
MLTSLPSNQALLAHFETFKDIHMRDLFNEDSNRFANFSLQAPHIFIDYSKNRISKTTLALLFKLAEETKLDAQKQSLFTGAIYNNETLNNTEKRHALHTVLRQPYSDQTKDLIVDSENLSEAVRCCHVKMQTFLNKVHNKEYFGAKGKAIDTLVSIGIGGSFLGPKMVTDALAPYALEGFQCHYVANIDSTDLYNTLAKINPDTTLFLIQSKSFTTLETLENANAVKSHLTSIGFSDADIAQHLAAVTSKEQVALDLGISPDRIFPMWDWVGGRYSLWSAIGLPIAFLLGMDNFKRLLVGAHEMDQHFLNAPIEQNAPALLGLIGAWYQIYFNTTSHAVLPYEQYLRTFPDHLQQLDMESNGKHVSRTGEVLTYNTGPIIWGGIGCNGQHAYHQLLHQGTHLLPSDFITCLTTHHPIAHHHQHLFSNCLSQSKALMSGKTQAEAFTELLKQGMNESEANKLAPHKENKGNQPSNTLVLNKLTPESLGALTALYEHKTFVQSVIWDINPFDQWGVELGKELGQEIYQAMSNKELANKLDSSSLGLLNLYKV